VTATDARTDIRHVVCPHCGAVNRVAAGRPAAAARCGKCHAAIFTGKPVNADTASFDRHVTRNDIGVLVDFWAPWCGPCHAMAPSFEAAAGELEPGARLLKVNVDEEPEVAARYGIQSIPTLMLFRNGKAIGRTAGAMDKGRLLAWAKPYL
jgi:thioredoxin 2